MQSETFQFGRAPLAGEEDPRARPTVAEVAEQPLLCAALDVVAWRDADRLVIVNFGEVPAFLHPARELLGEAELLSSTDPARLTGEVALERFILLPREAVLLRLVGR